MTRKTVTLTSEDAKKLDRLVRRTKSDVSKVMRMALRSFYARELQKNMEEVYKKYYETTDAESDEIADDFTSASVSLW